MIELSVTLLLLPNPAGRTLGKTSAGGRGGTLVSAEAGICHGGTPPGRSDAQRSLGS